jgi:hypothetical protein
MPFLLWQGTICSDCWRLSFSHAAAHTPSAAGRVLGRGAVHPRLYSPGKTGECVCMTLFSSSLPFAGAPPTALHDQVL